MVIYIAVANRSRTNNEANTQVRTESGEGFKDSKGGEDWVKTSKGYGWRDSKGNVWVPTGQGGTAGTGTSGPAHGGPHWDVQKPGGKGYINVRPGERLN